MKLLVVLSVIALGYADKLDRTYLPPRNAATAGGSPGALTAPGIQPGPDFGQGLPSGSGSQPGTGFAQTGTSGFGQGPSGSVKPSNGFGSSNNGGSNGNGFGYTKTGASAPGTSYDSAFESRIPSASSGFGSSPSGANQAGGATSPFDQGFGQGALGPNAAQVYTPERAQASADRSAEILKYINENNIDSYRYSYETSNGISAEEAGEATNGVRAQGGYSYTGDDGTAYSVTYTADENGYQPQGEHLPTPHPIPEEILKSIEENARAAAAGTQEGAYRPEEYDSEFSPQQYNTGATSFNQPQGQNSGSVEDFQSGQVINRPQSNQYSASQDQLPQRRPSGPSGQYGQENQGSSGQFNGKVSAGLGQTTQGQGQGANGYTYKQPQSAFGSGSGFGQGPSSQYRPQTNGQGPTSYSAGSSSTGSGSNGNQGASASSFGNGRPSAPSFSPSQTQTNGQRPTSYSAGSSSTGSDSNGNQGASAPSFSKGRPSAPSFGPSQTQYQAGLGQSNLPSGNQAGAGTSNQGQQYQSSVGSPQGSQYRPGNKPFGSAGPTGQGNQYQTNANQDAFGGINGASQGNQNAGSSIGQSQSQYGSKPSAGSNGLGQTSFTGNQNAQSSRPNGRGPQYQQNGKQPAYGSNVGPSQGASPFGSGNQGFGSGAAGSAGTRDSQPIQAPYQYNRPGQSFDAQPQRPGFNAASQGSNGIPSQGNQRGTEQFGGPRQPPSFSPQEGYKY